MFYTDVLYCIALCNSWRKAKAFWDRIIWSTTPFPHLINCITCIDSPEQVKRSKFRRCRWCQLPMKDESFSLWCYISGKTKSAQSEICLRHVWRFSIPLIIGALKWSYTDYRGRRNSQASCNFSNLHRSWLPEKLLRTENLIARGPVREYIHRVSLIKFAANHMAPSVTDGKTTDNSDNMTGRDTNEAKLRSFRARKKVSKNFFLSGPEMMQ